MFSPAVRFARRLAPGRRSAVALALAAVCAALPGWVVWRVDRQIRAVFDAPGLEAPSVAFAEPVRLAPRLPWSPDELEGVLKNLAYTPREGASEPGSYQRRGAAVTIYLRALSVPGRRRAPQRVNVEFSGDGGSVARLTDEGGAELPAVETEAPRIGTFYGPRRVARDPVPLAAVPQTLRDAVLAVEDRRFYEHSGLDLRGIARALSADVKAGEAVQGGSSIPQQLAKNLFLSRERTLHRKLREALYALRLDRLYSKNRLLETYLNQVFLGADHSLQICGVAEGARHYFGVEVGSVTLPQAALLAGLIRGPGNYDPFRKPEAALARRHTVLDLLLAEGRITKTQRDQADAAPLELGSAPRPVAPGASAYVDALESQFAKLHPSLALDRAGLKIYTPLDPVAQTQAQRALDRGLDDIEQRRGFEKGTLEGAVVLLDPGTGAVRALIGGRGGAPNTFNRAVQARRQPGSLMKPFIYAAALATGRFTTASLLADEPIELQGRDGPWRPRNSDGRFLGPVTLRRALQSSLNVPSVRLFQEIGPQAAIDLCRRAGITSPLGFDYSVVLGTSEVTALEIAAAFAVFPAGGLARPPRFSSLVLDAAGAPLAGPAAPPPRAVSAPVAFLVNDLLRGACKHGTAYALGPLAWQYPLAGKTGTSSGGRDAWFIGYTPKFLALVWLGPDTPRSLHLLAADEALPLWRKVVDALPGCLAAEEPVAPPGVVKVQIDPRTGLLAGRGCGGGVEEWFLQGTEPREVCPHRNVPRAEPETQAPAEGDPGPGD